MNWAIYLTTVGLIVAAAGFLHQLLMKKKDATIETLTEKNKWLEKQLESAEKNSTDILTDRLAKRISAFQIELERLSKDYEANESLIKEKEEEIRQNKELMQDIVKEMANRAGEFRDFKSHYLCPHCESPLKTLKDIEEDEWTGSLREYDCGYSEIDGATHVMCPCDPEYPDLNQVQLKTRYNQVFDNWSCSYSEATLKTWRLPHIVVSGKTEKEAKYRMELTHEDRKEICPDPPIKQTYF
jgi:rubredoxin